MPSGSAGSSRAHSLTTSQRAPRSLTPVPTIRARIVQAERRERELGSDARLPHTEPYILFVIIFERLWLSEVHTPSNRALPKHRPCFASPLLQALLYCTRIPSARTLARLLLQIHSQSGCCVPWRTVCSRVNDAVASPPAPRPTATPQAHWDVHV